MEDDFLNNRYSNNVTVFAFKKLFWKNQVEEMAKKFKTFLRHFFLNFNSMVRKSNTPEKIMCYYVF